MNDTYTQRGKVTAFIAQSVCKYSLRTPPRPKSLLLRSTQLHQEGENDMREGSKITNFSLP